MRLKNLLIVVEDIEKSKAFYRDLFGMHIVTDFGGNVILTEGLVLQERGQWETAIGRDVRKGGNDAELYFEEYDFDGFLAKLRDGGHQVEIITQPEQGDGGKKIVRLYDPDGHVIEVAEACESRRRFL